MPNAWPTPQQEIFRETLATYYPDFYARWQERIERALKRKQLDPRREAIIVATVEAVLHASPAIIEQHINEAFDVGASVVEVLEAMLRVGAQEGNHALSSGGEALWNVVQERQAAGRPVPARGRAMTAAELPPHAPWTPVQFPYQTPWPRHWRRLIKEFNPERARIQDETAAALSKLPVQLSRQMIELIDTAVDAVVRWKAPRLDHHIHEALNCGSNVQEIVEIVLVCAEAAQRARGSHISARLTESGVEIIHHGLQGLWRVIGEREGASLATAGDYGDAS